MLRVGWAHFPEKDGDEDLDLEIEGMVDVKNFTAVFHDDVQAVGGLRFVCVRNHAKGKPANVARMSGGHGRGQMQLRRAPHVQVVFFVTAHEG